MWECMHVCVCICVCMRGLQGPLGLNENKNFGTSAEIHARPTHIWVIPNSLHHTSTLHDSLRICTTPRTWTLDPHQQVTVGCLNAQENFLPPLPLEHQFLIGSKTSSRQWYYSRKLVLTVGLCSDCTVG